MGDIPSFHSLMAIVCNGGNVGAFNSVRTSPEPSEALWGRSETVKESFLGKYLTWVGSVASETALYPIDWNSSSGDVLCGSASLTRGETEPDSGSWLN